MIFFQPDRQTHAHTHTRMLVRAKMGYLSIHSVDLREKKKLRTEHLDEGGRRSSFGSGRGT